MAWLSLTLEVDAAAADVLGDALLAAGAHSVIVDDPQAERCALSALLSLEASPEAALRHAAAECGLAPLPAFTIRRVEDDDWVRRTQAQFAPFAVGERLWVGASWHEPPPGSPAAIVRIDPGLAFGTGSHPSTRLALDYLAHTLRGGERVLDYGCGSGILAVSAAKLGASEVDAVDIDAQSVATTAENAVLNAVVLRAAQPEALEARTYDLVVANILAQPLILLAPLLAARCRPGGRIVLSGILASQAEEVAAAYAPFFATGVDRTIEGWALLAGVRR